jgi:hypothetical protein
MPDDADVNQAELGSDLPDCCALSDRSELSSALSSSFADLLNRLVGWQTSSTDHFVTNSFVGSRPYGIRPNQSSDRMKTKPAEPHTLCY